jgi:hypothetical protein
VSELFCCAYAFEQDIKNKTTDRVFKKSKIPGNSKLEQSPAPELGGPKNTPYDSSLVWRTLFQLRIADG